MPLRQKIQDVAAWCLFHDEPRHMKDPTTYAVDLIIESLFEEMTRDDAADALWQEQRRQRLNDSPRSKAKAGITHAIDVALGDKP